MSRLAAVPGSVRVVAKTLPLTSGEFAAVAVISILRTSASGLRWQEVQRIPIPGPHHTKKMATAAIRNRFPKRQYPALSQL